MTRNRFDKDNINTPNIRSLENCSQVSLNIYGNSINTLIDTGAEISVISDTLATELCKNKNVKKENCRLNNINGVGGNIVFVLGKITLKIKISTLTINHTFIILNKVTYPLILGEDFLKTHQACIDYSKRTFSLYDNLIVIPLLDKPGTNYAYIIGAIKIPPLTDAMVNGKKA